MQERVPRVGESPEECRRRIMVECQQQWNDQSDEGIRLRTVFSEKAREQNNKTKDEVSLVSKHLGELGLETPCRADVTSLVMSSNNDNTKQLVPLSPSGGIGAMGVGDQEFGISKSLVEQADSATKGFVKHYNSSWRACTGGVCGENKDLQQARGVIRLSCLDQFGFCIQSISSEAKFDMVLDQLKGFVRGHHRRHMKEGSKKSQGPQVSIPHPVLVATGSKNLDM